MIGTGPPGARLSAGSSTSEQKELEGPITATKGLTCAYAFAFAAQRRKSKSPVWAVDSSHH